MDYILTIDVTPWAVASFVTGVVLGGVVGYRRDVSGPAALISSILALWLAFTPPGVNALVTVAWFLAIGAGGFALGSYVASWYRRYEQMALMLMNYMYALLQNTQEERRQ